MSSQNIYLAVHHVFYAHSVFFAGEVVFYQESDYAVANSVYHGRLFRKLEWTRFVAVVFAVKRLAYIEANRTVKRSSGQLFVAYSQKRVPALLVDLVAKHVNQ